MRGSCSKKAEAGRDISWKKIISAAGVGLWMCEIIDEMRASGMGDEESTFQVTRTKLDLSGLEQGVRCHIGMDDAP